MDYHLCTIILIFCEIIQVLSAGKSAEFVTFGSLIKLFNINFKIRLHSHDVKYGSGSGQQSVTGTQVPEDVNSHWLIKGHGANAYKRGAIIKCGDVVILEHVSTNKNLHSHSNFRSPLSGQQEISCYGNKGIGDSGDYWVVICSGPNWKKGDKVAFKHVDTNAYLCSSRYTYGHPISGQHEITGGSSKGSCASDWKAVEGVYLEPVDSTPSHDHSEF